MNQKIHNKKEIESAYLLGVFNVGGISALSIELDKIKQNGGELCEDIINVAKKYHDVVNKDNLDVLTSKTIQLIEDNAELLNKSLEGWINRALKTQTKKKKATVKAKEEKVDVGKFLLWFNNKKDELLGGGVGLFRTLPTEALQNLTKLKRHYNIEEFNKAISVMATNEWVMNTNNFTPKHFLSDNNFTKYLNGTIQAQSNKFGKHVSNVNETEIEKLKKQIENG